MGYGIEVDRFTGKVVREHDTVMCGHCQHTMDVEPSKNSQVIVRVAPPCGGCGRLLCGVCQAKGGCEPWEKWMAQHEARQRLLKAAGG